MFFIMNSRSYYFGNQYIVFIIRNLFKSFLSFFKSIRILGLLNPSQRRFLPQLLGLKPIFPFFHKSTSNLYEIPYRSAQYSSTMIKKEFYLWVVEKQKIDWYNIYKRIMVLQKLSAGFCLPLLYI